MNDQLTIPAVRRARFERRGLLAIAPEAYGLEVEERTADRGFTEEGDAAVVTIRGPLMARAEGWMSLFCDDYESIGARVRAAFDSPARRVVLRIDSPGGDAAGCFELARDLRAMAVASGKPLLAYADSVCASAAYAIACAATGGIATAPTAYVGSIGVYESLVDWTAQTRAQGINLVIVTSGEHKVDRNPDVPITDEAKARVQAQVDQYAGLFFDLVAELRGGDPDQYRALKGGVFLGSAALGAALVDRVAGWKAALAGEATQETEAMANSKKGFDAAKEALRAVVDDEKASEDERDKARKSLRALEEEPAKKDDGDGDEGKAAEDPPKKEDAKTEEKKDEEARAAAARASAPPARAAAAPLTMSDVERMLDQRAKASAEQAQRDTMLGARPDLEPGVRAALGKLPPADLKVALEGIPRKAPLRPAAGAAAMPSVTGETQGNLDYSVDAETERWMNKRMGHTGASAPTDPQAMVFGSFDRDRAAQHLVKIEKGAA